jgi:hypothetical protein
MNIEAITKLDDLIETLAKSKYGTNMPVTLSEEDVMEFLEKIVSWTFQWYSSQVMENMTHNTITFDDFIDNLAEQDEEYRIHQIDKRKLH